MESGCQPCSSCGFSDNLISALVGRVIPTLFLFACAHVARETHGIGATIESGGIGGTDGRIIGGMPSTGHFEGLRTTQRARSMRARLAYSVFFEDRPIPRNIGGGDIRFR